MILHGNIKLILKFLLIIYFVINLLWGTLMTFYYNLKGQLNSPSDSIEHSKKKGVFVEELSASPNQLIVGNSSVAFREVWVEHVNVLSFVMSVIPKYLEIPLYSKKDYYNVCITFLDNSYFIQQRKSLSSNYHICFKNSNSGFIHAGDLCYYTFEDLDWSQKTIIFRKSWKKKDSFKYKVILKRNQIKQLKFLF